MLSSGHVTLLRRLMDRGGAARLIVDREGGLVRLHRDGEPDHSDPNLEVVNGVEIVGHGCDPEPTVEERLALAGLLADLLADEMSALGLRYAGMSVGPECRRLFLGGIEGDVSLDDWPEREWRTTPSGRRSVDGWTSVEIEAATDCRVSN